MRKVSNTARSPAGSDSQGKGSDDGGASEPFAHIKAANRKVRLIDILRHYGFKIEKNPQRPNWSNNMRCPLPSHKGAKERTPSFGYNFISDHCHCLASSTRVLTKYGTFEIKDLVGQTVLVLGKDANWVEAKFKSYGKQKLFKITMTRNHQEKVIYATDEHRWFVRRGSNTWDRREVLTKNLIKGHRLSYTFPRCHTSQMVLSPFGVSRGIVFGDGTANEGGSFAYLVGDKDDELKKWFPLNKITQDSTREDRKIVHNLPKYFKKKPDINEAAQYLYGWLAGYFAADGCVAKDGTIILNSAVRENLEFVRCLCTRLGIGTYGITQKLREGFPGREPSLIYGIHFVNNHLTPEFFLLSEHRKRFEACTKKFARLGWFVQSVEETDREEEVYCAEVEDGHAFTLEDNILTGNCMGCNFTGRAVEFISAMEGVSRTSVAEKILAQYGEDVSSDDFQDYEDDISPILLECSKYIQDYVRKYKDNPKALAYIDKLIWWLDFYLAQKAPTKSITAEEFRHRFNRVKELLDNEVLNS